MANDFPHISDTAFPILDNVDPYKYENNFDYSKYDAVQMEITICSVPWDVGLIHVGNAQIGGLGNVVDFESEEARDAWFDSLENKFTWTAKYRAYHTDGYIEVPLPYQKCVLYNYIYVEYHNLPIEYAEGGKDKFFYFIRSCESLSPNNCKIEILRDTWQTYIYDVDIAYLMLQQGHAPMSITSADEYLTNPLANNAYLLADDVNFGTTYVSRRANEIILNSGEMYACIVTSASLRREWGVLEEYTARTPDGQSLLGGQPSMFCYAIEPERLNAFLENVKALIPQFLQTIKAVFFVKQEFVNTTESFDFHGLHEEFILYIIEQATNELELVELNKVVFGYSDEYADIAKLYTYPYAYLEISDETGNVNQVRIEETEGNISLTVTTSLAYPWLNLDGHLKGIGSGGNSVTFSNISGHSFDFSGDWFNHLQQWNIPTFAVNVAASTVYEYETLYERRQKELENATVFDNAIRAAEMNRNNADASALTAYANSYRSAETAKQNAYNSAETAKQNAYNSADADKQNAYNSAETAKQNAYNSAETVKQNVYNSAETDKGNADRSALAARDNTRAIALASKKNSNKNAETAQINSNRAANGAHTQFGYQRSLARRNMELLVEDNEEQPGYYGFMGNSTWQNIEKISDDESTDYNLSWEVEGLELFQMSQTSVLNGVSGAISSTMGGAMAGMAAGPGGAGVGAVTGLVGSAVNLATASASLPLAISTSHDIAQAYRDAATAKTNHAIHYANEMNRLQRNLERDKYYAEQDWLTRCADSAKSVAITSAQLAKETADENAGRTYDADYANADRTYTAATLNNDDTEGTAKTNADNAEGTAKTNADNAEETAKMNADNTEGTAKTNADNAEETAKMNADNTEGTAKMNADNTRDAAVENAQATRDTALENNSRKYENDMLTAETNLETGTAAIQADIDQAGLKAPYQFGEFSNGDTSTTRPIGLFCNVVTQTKDAIEQAGDHFLRFGYNVNRAWKFDGFNLMPHFTYWKAADMWISGNNVPDAYLDELRFFILGGVCVWRNPDDIGRISIYENN